MKKTWVWGIPLIVIIGLAVVLHVQFHTGKPEHLLLHKSAPELSLSGVCPPFFLLTEEGDTINPITGKNADKPYSPKQTCGKCHDYDLITQGFHFQQGKDEQPTEMLKERVQWASSPGNYGGSWCSPAPLYNYLASKTNDDAALLDMTSYDFVKLCGVCHPGGGPLEYDRNNVRYDLAMVNPENKFESGGTNDLDGDYYKARWTESGVIEADCFLCHLPEYDNEERVRQITNLNYRYAAMAGSGFGIVTGSVAAGQPVAVSYHQELFNADGTVEPHIVKEPRTETCLWCHAKPGYKKRGANFMERTDVHLRAGLKCVDCHPAGSMAVDERIKGKEVHQFGKGDDPGGHVRDDLDNTLRECTDCHNTGYLGAPIAKHSWLPPLHLDKMACQACHIPERTIKSAHYVASDVFNPGTKIPSKGKYLWTFYGPDMNYWNHYGDLEMMGYDDKPTFTFKPELARYKDKIYPVNRVHSSWPGILTVGKEGLMQPRMSDVYKMWDAHRKDAAKYPELSRITDDSGDGVVEVNRPEEIDALITSVSEMLKSIKYPLEGKRVVWIMNNRVYRSGNDSYEMDMESWEASPYGNVHKYSHDVMPANAAYGTNGCTDCHSYGSHFFTAPVLLTPFDENGKMVTQVQYNTLGLSAFRTHLGIIRESFAKPILYALLIVTLILLVIHLIRRYAKDYLPELWMNMTSLIMALGLALMFILVLVNKELSLYMLPARLQLDGNHFIVGLFILALLVSLLLLRINRSEPPINYRVLLTRGLNGFSMGILLMALLSGFMMLINVSWIFYTLFDLSLILALIAIIFMVSERILKKISPKIGTNNLDKC